MKRFFSLVTLLPNFLCASADIFTDPSKLPSKTFDYIVVGGGTAGNVVANRLSENSKHSVLVLEAGFDQTSNLNVSAPMLCVGLSPGTPLDWNYTTIAQPGFNGRSIPYARGFGLGGSSLINDMVYNRGSQDDWDYYARVAGGDPSLRWSSMKHYMTKAENFTLPHTTRNVSGEYDPVIHSNQGLLGVSLPAMSVSYDKPVIAVTNELAEFPYQRDMNGGNPIGIGWTQFSITNGQRTDSNSAYIQPFLKRPNLTVLTGARATRVLQTGSVRGAPVFRGVEFAASATAPRISVVARKEVVLSAGSFNTPQLLMLSGIGDPTDLRAAGIRPLVALPSVGRNMTDHVRLANKFQANVTDTVNNWALPANFAPALAQWKKTRTGPLTDPGFSQIGWLRVPDDDELLEAYPDPSTGPTSAHFELVFVHGTFPDQVTTPGISYVDIVTCLITPTSRGTITLASNDPFAAPIIDPNFLSTDFDKALIVYALRAALRYASANAMKGFLSTAGAFDGATTDAELLDYAATNSGTVWHPIGTAAMSAPNAAYGVVNPDLTVKKVIGLSVVDGSSMPYVPSMHPQGAIYLWAERAADQIKARASSW